MTDIEILLRIEAKLDIIIAALAEDECEHAQNLSLDGTQYPGERDQSQSLG